MWATYSLYRVTTCDSYWCSLKSCKTAQCGWVDLTGRRLRSIISPRTICHEYIQHGNKIALLITRQKFHIHSIFNMTVTTTSTYLHILKDWPITYWDYLHHDNKQYVTLQGNIITMSEQPSWVYEIWDSLSGVWLAFITPDMWQFIVVIFKQFFPAVYDISSNTLISPSVTQPVTNLATWSHVKFLPAVLKYDRTADGLVLRSRNL